MVLPSNNTSDSDGSTIGSLEVSATPKPTSTPKPTAAPTGKELLKTTYGIENTIRLMRICREYSAMLYGFSDGTHTYEESRDLMKKMYSLADAPIASSLRTRTRDMLSAWTEGDQEGWIVAVESMTPICVMEKDIRLSQ